MTDLQIKVREIGIRKSLGAKKSVIKRQFLTEAVIICLIGGEIGVLSGILNGFLIGIIANNILVSFPEYSELFGTITVQTSGNAIVISLLFSVLTGVFFGMYPAGKAARMNPIDALRFE